MAVRVERPPVTYLEKNIWQMLSAMHFTLPANVGQRRLRPMYAVDLSTPSTWVVCATSTVQLRFRLGYYRCHLLTSEIGHVNYSGVLGINKLMITCSIFLI